MQSGQASTEFILLSAAAFIIVIVFLVLSSNSLLTIGVQQGYNDARTSVQSLAEAADSVYAQGEGATMTVTAILPGSINFDKNYTYIGRPLRAPSAPANTVNINLNGTDISASTRAPLTGSFPSSAGTHQMKVTSHGAYVSIGSHLIEATPSSIYATMGPDGRETVALSFSVVSGDGQTNNTVRVNIFPQWNHSDVALTVSPSFFSAYEHTGAPIILVFSAAANASGIYTSELVVNATGASSDETFTIPVTAEVSQ